MVVGRKGKPSTPTHFKLNKTHRGFSHLSDESTVSCYSSPLPPSKNKSRSESCIKEGVFTKNGKQYIRIITQDYVRDVLIPSPSPSIYSTVICNDELNKLKQAPLISDDNLRNELRKKMKEEKERKTAESILRKKELTSYSSHRSLGPKLTKLEYEATQKANFMLKRAKEMRLEDEDDVKLCNKLILGTKCQAIREAQVAEKKIIEKEVEDEERRLHEMLEQDRKKALQDLEAERQKEKAAREAYIKALNNQVKANALEREMEAERIEEEARLLNEAAMEAQLNELRMMKEREMEKARVQAELSAANRKIMEAAEREKREAKLADLKIQEYMRKKAEEEDRREEELNRQKLEREKEIAKMRSLQQRAQDEQAAKDEANAKRQQEEFEHSWRKKEMTAAMKRKAMVEELKKGREKQVEDQRRAQLEERQRIRLELARQDKEERLINEVEKARQRERFMALEEYRSNLLKQMNDREQEKIKERKTLFEEGLSMELDRKAKEMELQETIQKKLDAVRTHNIRPSYIKEIERHLGIKNSENQNNQ